MPSGVGAFHGAVRGIDRVTRREIVWVAALAAAGLTTSSGCAGPSAPATVAAPARTPREVPPLTPSRDVETARRWAAVGSRRLRQGDPSAALLAFQRALAADPLDAKLHHLLGGCYAELGDPVREAAEYRKGLALNDQLAELWRDLGHASLMLDDPVAARAAYLRFLATEPGDGQVLYNLAQLEHDRGNADRARELLEGALRASAPGSSERARIEEQLRALSR